MPDLTDAERLILQIFKRCQDTPEYDTTNGAAIEAMRLDACISAINGWCDEFIAEHRLPAGRVRSEEI